MVIFVEVIKVAQSEVDANVYTTEYVPGVLLPRFIKPVEALIDKPAVDEKVPPPLPVSVTAAVPADEQYGEPV